jgi:hypothetical protein
VREVLTEAEDVSVGVRVLWLVESRAQLVVDALAAVLGDDVLDDDLDGSERHVAERDARLRPPAPLGRRQRLEKVFDDAEEGDRVEEAVAEVVLDAAGALPDALEDELGVLGLARGRERALVDKADRHPLQEDKERSAKGSTASVATLQRQQADVTHPKMISRLPPLKMRRMIMLRKRESSLASAERAGRWSASWSRESACLGGHGPPVASSVCSSRDVSS